MKKSIAILLALILALALLAGCSGGGTQEEADPQQQGEEQQGAEPAERTKLKIGATITPHAEILEQAKDTLAEQGIDLEIVEFTEYVQPNLNVESGDLDANYFQHTNYLDWFNTEYDTHIVSVGKIHYEPFGIYAGKTASIEELPDGAIVSVPNDSTNEARALLLLEAQGLIKLKEGVGLEATVFDIEENPKNIEIKELEAAQLTLTLPDVDLAVINGNFAIQEGLKAKDALALEDQNSEAIQMYANIVCVKEGNEENAAVKALVDVLKGDAVKEYINTTYEGAVVPMD